MPWITYRYGWPAAFIATGALGLLWIGVWLPLYGAPAGHPRVGPRELELIQSDPPDTPIRIPWLRLVGYRQTWAVAAAKFGTDPVWWLYLFWIPDFLHRRYGIDLQSMALPLVVIYLIADVGSVGGGPFERLALLALALLLVDLVDHGLVDLAIGDLAQREHGRLVVLPFDRCRRTLGELARTLRRHQYELEAVVDHLEAIFHGDPCHRELSGKIEANS